MFANVLAMDLATHILIVDDDDGIRSLISSFLQRHGFTTETVPNPAAMREAMARRRPDLIVLDVMMPEEDGLSALRKLQGRNPPPVIMLSAVGSDVDRIVGLEVGAEDYLAKPCNPRELLARIRTVLRRLGRGSQSPLSESGSSDGAARAIPVGGQGETLRFLNWRLDPTGFTLIAPDGQLVILTYGEFRLLRAFAEHPRRVLSRDQLMDFARNSDSDSFDRAIDVQVSRLRRKLAKFGGDELIGTVRNEGYMFTAPVSRG